MLQRLAILKMGAEVVNRQVHLHGEIARHIWVMIALPHVPHRPQRHSTQRELPWEPGCRSDLDIPHGQSGAVRGKPVAHPAQTPERWGAHDAQGLLLRRVGKD